MAEVATDRFGRAKRTATELLEEARENMLYSLPFFGTLALELDLKEDKKHQKSSTDGTVIRFDPAFIQDLPFEDRQYLIAHEVLHCALQHHVRCGNRHKGKWNYACDLVVDKILIEAGFELPSELKPNFRAIMEHGDKTAEEIYALLKDEDDFPEDYGGAGANGKGSGNGGKSRSDSEESEGDRPDDPFGGVDTPSEGSESSTLGEQQKEWEGKVSKATAVAKRMGKGGLALERIAEQIQKQHEVSWKELLRDFVEKTSKGDYTWAMPNRRYLTTCGLYLPALHSRECGKVVIAIDTSGSINTRELSAFEVEVNAIFSEFPSHVVVMYCDSRIAGVDEFREGDEIKFKPRGGGGTSFLPVFKEVEKKHPDAECIIYFTDGMGRYPDKSDKPTLWLMTHDHEPGSSWYPPFGRVIRLKNLDD